MGMHPEDIAKTTFCTRKGAFGFNVMPFVLCNSPRIFQRLMDFVLVDLQGTSCLVYLDSIMVIGWTFQEHLQKPEAVLKRLKETNLKIKSACQLFCKKMNFWGHVISTEGVDPDPDKAEVIKTYTVPWNAKETCSFLGLASYYGRFMANLLL